MPNYKEIYTDMIIKKYPDKIDACRKILEKKSISCLDVIKLNRMIVGKSDKETEIFNQKLKSYDKKAILRILADQQKNNLTNISLAKKYNLSRNSVTKWKRIYLHHITSP